jgi:hypothetical protein
MSEDQNALAEALSGDNENDVKNDTQGPGETEELHKLEESTNGLTNEDDPLSVKKRLGMQAKKHQREMRALHDRMSEMQARMGGDNSPNNTSTYQPDPFTSPGQPNPPGMNEQEKIQHAVKMALGMREHEQKQAEENQRMAHVHKQYQRLNNEFDKASDKYEDFDDVVRGDDVPFTPHVRDALLLVENPAEVAYRLGKNPSELERISKLHPLDQAREVNKLSFSLMGGHEGKPQSSRTTPLGNVRANPGTSQAVTGKTPPSVIRARMKAGDWK